jgi:hypothetical protein
MRRIACLVRLFLTTFGFAQNQSSSDVQPYKNPSLPVEQRIQDLLGRMTLGEKVAMLSGADWMQSVPNERLGIPSIKMADGFLGIRSWSGPSAQTNAPGARVEVMTTSFPANVAMAAAWDTDLVQAQGRAIARELKALGRDNLRMDQVRQNACSVEGGRARIKCVAHASRWFQRWRSFEAIRAEHRTCIRNPLKVNKSPVRLPRSLPYAVFTSTVSGAVCAHAIFGLLIAALPARAVNPRAID